MGPNFWNVRTDERLAQWADFRDALSNLPLEDAIKELNLTWSTAPMSNYNLDPANSTDWPNPWDLLAENYWCDVAKALGIMYTLYLTGHKGVEIELRSYFNLEEKIRYNVVWVDNGKYILNYYPFEIVNTAYIEEKELNLLNQYTVTDLGLDKY
jgi:hypothetical protein